MQTPDDLMTELQIRRLLWAFREIGACSPGIRHGYDILNRLTPRAAILETREAHAFLVFIDSMTGGMTEERQKVAMEIARQTVPERFQKEFEEQSLAVIGSPCGWTHRGAFKIGSDYISIMNLWRSQLDAPSEEKNLIYCAMSAVYNSDYLPSATGEAVRLAWLDYFWPKIMEIISPGEGIPAPPAFPFPTMV